MSAASQHAAEPHDVLNAMNRGDARDALERCCGASRWVDAMLEQRPFDSTATMLETADALFDGLDRGDHLEAFSHHPQIGADLAELREKFASTAGWSHEEQSSVQRADEATLLALRDENRRYLQRFGFIFIVCASGKSASEMLALLRARLSNEPDVELQTAAGEQAKITRLRLQKLAVAKEKDR